MKYYVLNNLDWIDTSESADLKETHDIEYYHDWKYISDKPLLGFTSYMKESSVELKFGNTYHVVVVYFDVNSPNTRISNLACVVGIYDDRVYVNKLISTIKENHRKSPNEWKDFFFESERINPEWKTHFAEMKSVNVINMVYKQGD